jgi:NMD protein affecting ribosome stability and mRNA decay
VKSSIARRLRKVAPTPATGEVETVVCSKCGQRFAIHNHGADAQLAEKQVAWLEDQLVWDHIQERKHHGNVELPNLS